MIRDALKSTPRALILPDRLDPRSSAYQRIDSRSDDCAHRVLGEGAYTVVVVIANCTRDGRVSLSPPLYGYQQWGADRLVADGMVDDWKVEDSAAPVVHIRESLACYRRVVSSSSPSPQSTTRQ